MFAALVDRSLDAMGTLLFTATPREELDQIRQFRRLRDLAFAGQLRAIVAGHTRATAAQRFFAGGCPPQTLRPLITDAHRPTDQARVFTPDGDYRWTTRGGWPFTRKRLGY